MKKIFFIATILVVLFFVPFNVSALVVINEIAWMGTTNSANDEWIELYNNGNTEINLNGWGLYEERGEILIEPLVGIIGAESYYLIERTDDNTVPNIEASQPPTGWGGYGLNNNGENLQLLDNDSNIVDEVNRSDGWFEGNKDTKQTMERVTAGWQTSSSPGGTPKAQNSSGATEEPKEPTPETPEPPPVSTSNNPPIAEAGDNIIAFVNQEIKLDGSKSSDPDGNELSYSWNTGDGNSLDKMIITHKYLYPGTYLATLTVFDGKYYTTDTITIKIQSQQITINEFLPNPSGKDEEEEWIEIYNDSDSITDISGWQLDDIASGSKPFVFPKNTLIAPKSYIVFSRQTTGITLNNDKDSVRLLMPEGVVFQEIDYENPPQGKSSAHTDQGFVWSESTPGMANIVSIPQSAGEEIVYQYEPQKQTVKEYSGEYTIEYSPPDQEIEGGYTFLTEPEQEKTEPQEQSLSQLAVLGKLSAKESSSKQSPITLILIITAVILGASTIGLLLTKLRKKFP